MASASSSYYVSFLFALLCMCIHFSPGASQSVINPESSPKAGRPGEQNPNPDFPPADAHRLNAEKSPAPSPVYAPGPSPSPSLATPASAPTPLLTLSVPILRSSSDSSDSTKRRRARILGLVLVSFAGALQAFVVLFLFVKRRQMLKHVYGSHDHSAPPHIWANA